MNDVTHDDALENLSPGNNAGTAEQMETGQDRRIFFIGINAETMQMSRKSSLSWRKIGDRAV